MRLPFANLQALPLGIELGAERVAVVVPRRRDGGLTVAESAVEVVPETPDSALDEALAEALRRALDSLRSSTRRSRCSRR